MFTHDDGCPSTAKAGLRGSDGDSVGQEAYDTYHLPFTEQLAALCLKISKECIMKESIAKFLGFKDGVWC